MHPEVDARIPSSSYHHAEGSAPCLLQASSREQEEAVSDAIEAVLRRVLEAIREHQLDELGYRYSSTFVTESLLQIYASVNVRYDPGTEDKVLSSAGKTLATDIKAGSIIAPMDDSVIPLTETTSPLTGTLLLSPEPQPATIDRWARGWLLSTGASTEGECSRARQERSRQGDDWSDGSPSMRSVKSIPSSSRLYRQPSRKQSAAKEDKPAVPFPLGPDTREDQSLPPATLPLSREARGSWKVAGGCRGKDEGKDSDAWLEEHGGREWIIDGSGELRIKPCGEGTRPKTRVAVDALYKFRDTTGSVQQHGKVLSTKMGSGGRDDNVFDNSKKRISSSLVTSSERSFSRSASRRTSTRPSSQRPLDRENGRFFTLEPTVQPNIINSMGQPGPGVSVSDGSSTKDGPSWPQDPNHMSLSDYRQQRQRMVNHGVMAHSSVGQGDAETSSLGFSLETVQTAPALGGFGRGMDEGGGEGFGGKRAARKQEAPKVDTAGPNHHGRGDSFIAFEDVNPFHGGTPVSSSSSVAGSSRRDGGELSPLSMSLGCGQLLGHEGPESEHEPSFGHVGRGTPKHVGLLPKVKQKSRERPLTHERPVTHNPRDPKIVPAREQPHASRKILNKGTGDCNNTISDPRRRQPMGREGNSRAGETWRKGVRSSSSTKSFLSFPPLPTSLSGLGAPSGVVHGTDFPSSDGMTRKDYNNSSSNVITMMKPREILLEGLLR